MNITIHIERLILEDLPITPCQRAQIQAAVETELARQLAAHGLASSLLVGGVWSRISTGDIQVGRDDTPARLGQRIAWTISRGIGGSGR